MPIRQKHHSVGITAFLDILGFGNRILDAKTDSDISSLVSDIRMIQDQFEFKPKDPFVRKTHSYYKKTVLAFSDSVIVNVPLKSTIIELQGEFDLIMSELNNFALAQCECVLKGMFLRGGVGLGWWYRNGNILASRSLTTAYKQENSANVPVIALTDELYQFLCEHNDRAHYSSDTDSVRTLFRQYSSLTEEMGTFWFLDYLSVVADSSDWITSNEQNKLARSSSSRERELIYMQGFEKNIEILFISHAQQIQKAHLNSNCERVRKKYEWLARYHNEVASNFSDSSTIRCEL